MSINAAFFTAIHDQAALCRTCEDVQRLADNALPALADVVTAYADAEAVLAAGQELLTLSAANLAEVVTYIGKLKTEFIGPQLAAYAKVVADGASTITAVASATAAIEAAGAAIPGCTISI